MSKVIVRVVLDPQKLSHFISHGAVKTFSREFDIDTVNISNKLVLPIDPQKYNFVDVLIEKSDVEENKSE